VSVTTVNTLYPRLPTISDVARVAGVSTMTVSRTLNNHPSVRAQTRDDVMRAVDILGYRRNENARSLRPGHQTGLIGVGITNIANPYYAEFVLGVEDIASQHGRRVILATTAGDLGREEQVVSDFLGRQVEGLILVPSGDTASHVRPGRLRGVPLVFASRTVDGVATDSVVVDDEGGAYSGARHLLEAGHTAIGYLGAPDTSFTGARRLRGFLRALSDVGIVPESHLIRRGLRTVEEAKTATLDLLSTSRPTALFCSNNRNVVGALKALTARSRTGGYDDSALEIVSFDDFELSDLIPYRATIINHEARRLGQASAQMLFQRILSPDSGQPARTVSMPTWLEPRGTSLGVAP